MLFFKAKFYISKIPKYYQMTSVGEPERFTQNRIVKLFRDQLGYKYAGNWEDRTINSNIEEPMLRSYLKDKYSPNLINKALDRLRSEANNYERNLYENNKAVYQLLRFGIPVQEELGHKRETVHVINWKRPEENDFHIAEEVTVHGEREKRPDIVLYVNGIAIGVIELKRSTRSIGDGIRQNLVNQRKEFIGDFFSTVQLVFAGNDSEGLRYGTIGTPEKFFLKWKEDETDISQLSIDKYLQKICNKERIIELMYDFVLFDGGQKKLPRYHQYFGIKAAQEHVRKKEGGIIWHTQGSGKSIVMVMLAKWILANNPHARVVVLTDREELDKQIKRVFEDAGEEIYRTRSGRDLMKKLGEPSPRLISSLIHKFGVRDVEKFDDFIEELKAAPSKTFGELFVFVDECHRTQSGKLHKIMKAILQEAVFIGFTGTPLLKEDKQTSLEVFGKYIHTYKFNEAVEDNVVLDLMYEARDVDQNLTSPERVDAWFEMKTRGLNDFQKFELKKRWGTMQKVLSSRSRMNQVVKDIVFDFNVQPRLNSNAGNAILVAGSILEACKYYELFQDTELKNKSAIVTSYSPSIRNIVMEDTGMNTETEKEFVERIYQEIDSNDLHTSENYEDWAKEKFIKEPHRMKLLIVVDKLLTGFDAPGCSYLYIDKKMQDHGLFQAICRVNRLDTDDKEFGYIVDYKDLFKSLVNDKGTGALQVYTSELDYDNFKKEDCEVLMQSRLKIARERLENSLEEIALLCEPVEPPKSKLDYQHYFCGNTDIPDDLKDREIQRTSLYKATISLVRAYANITAGMEEAGYTLKEIEGIKKQVDFYIKLREEIRLASGETLDMKAYEADMRHLIDHYIQADPSRRISNFGDMPLMEIIDRSGLGAAIENLPEDIKNSKEAVAETIENNVRQKIIKDHLIDPAFFDQMSKLLSEIIIERRTGAIGYEEYLQKIADLVSQVNEGKSEDTPTELRTPAQRVLYNNLGKDKELAMRVHEIILSVRPDAWKGTETKERVIKAALYQILGSVDEVERIFEIIKKQDEY